MSYLADRDHIRTGVRTAWFCVVFAAASGGVLVSTSLPTTRLYDYRLDFLPVGLLITAAIFTPIMICAHIASVIGLRELSRRQCRVVKAGVAMSFVLLWLAARALEVTAFL
jgi:hypothetical protein